jgi:hypothetical protein
MSAVPKLTIVPDPLADLRARRALLADRLGALSGHVAKLNAAEDGERAALAAIGALGAAELGAMKAWLASGSGLAPKPDMERRVALNHELAAAMALSETLRAAAADCNAEHGAIAAEIAAIDERLEQGALDSVSQRFKEDLADLTKIGEEIQQKQARVFGCVVFLREIAERNQRAGRTDKAMMIFRRLEELASLPKPEFQPSVGATHAAAPAWQKQFEEVIK